MQRWVLTEAHLTISAVVFVFCTVRVMHECVYMCAFVFACVCVDAEMLCYLWSMQVYRGESLLEFTVCLCHV